MLTPPPSELPYTNTFLQGANTRKELYCRHQAGRNTCCQCQSANEDSPGKPAHITLLRKSSATTPPGRLGSNRARTVRRRCCHSYPHAIIKSVNQTAYPR